VAGDETVIELATSVAPDYVKLRRILKAWEADHPVEALHSEEVHDNVHDRFNQLGGYRLEAKARQILAGLVSARATSSGPRGNERRLGDARAPRRLLVQEPTCCCSTNRRIISTSRRCSGFRIICRIIRRDRRYLARPEFLNRLVGSIVEIRQRKLIRYRGNYDDYLEQREAHEEQLLAAFKNQEREIGR